MSNVIKMLDICIMGLLRMRMDALHYALLAVVVLLAVYAFGSFREANDVSPVSRINSLFEGEGLDNKMEF